MKVRNSICTFETSKQKKNLFSFCDFKNCFMRCNTSSQFQRPSQFLDGFAIFGAVENKTFSLVKLLLIRHV